MNLANLIAAGLLVLSLPCNASDFPEDVLKLLIESRIFGRDSGQEVTKEFLNSCLEPKDSSHYLVQCDDILFTHHVSFFESKENKERVVLVIADGDSVENRWVYERREGKYALVTADLWPIITDKMVSDLLILHTGEKKYTERYVASVAHSSYRTIQVATNRFDVGSGIPDNNYKLELGTIEWNGAAFLFRPRKSK